MSRYGFRYDKFLRLWIRKTDLGTIMVRRVCCYQRDGPGVSYWSVIVDGRGIDTALTAGRAKTRGCRWLAGARGAA